MYSSTFSEALLWVDRPVTKEIAFCFTSSEIININSLLLFDEFLDKFISTASRLHRKFYHVLYPSLKINLSLSKKVSSIAFLKEF